jgi:glycosyltransferase involved in cell wall biosynthesis
VGWGDEHSSGGQETRLAILLDQHPHPAALNFGGLKTYAKALYSGLLKHRMVEYMNMEFLWIGLSLTEDVEEEKGRISSTIIRIPRECWDVALNEYLVFIRFWIKCNQVKEMVLKELEAFKPDIIIVHDHIFALPAIKFYKQHKVVGVGAVHDGVNPPLHISILHTMDSTVYNSNITLKFMDYMVSMLKLNTNPQLKRKVIYPGLELEPRTCKKKDYVVYIGRVDPRKGLDTLLDIWDGGMPELHIISFNAPDIRKPNIIVHRGVADDVKHDIICHARLAVFPHTWEPFGIVALESARLGVRTLITDTMGVSEVLRSAYVIPLFVALNRKLLRDAIIRAYNDDDVERERRLQLESLRFTGFRLAEEWLLWLAWLRRAAG